VCISLGGGAIDLSRGATSLSHQLRRSARTCPYFLRPIAADSARGGEIVAFARNLAANGTFSRFALACLQRVINHAAAATYFRDGSFFTIVCGRDKVLVGWLAAAPPLVYGLVGERRAHEFRTHTARISRSLT
jgi:hypothetical protein